MPPDPDRPALPELGGPYFHALPVPAVVVALPAGQIMDLNGAWTAAFGYTRAEALGRTIPDLHLAQDPDQLDQLLAVLAEQSAITNREIELRDRAGAVTPYLLSVSAITVGGQPCALAVAQSIQAQKQLEGALAESVIKFRALFDASRDAIGVAQAGLHAYVNPAYLTLFGFDDPAELLHRPLLDLIAPASRPPVRDLAMKRAQGDEAASFYETRGLRRDGAEFDMEVKASVYTLNGERFTLALIRDITDRKQARFALQERLKEMTCLTRVSQALSRELSPEELGQEIIPALAAAMAYPAEAVPVLEFDGRRFAGADDYAGLTHGLQADLVVQGATRCRLAVYYRTAHDFLLPFEQDLVEGVARMVSLWLEHRSEQRHREAIIAVSAALRTTGTRAEMLSAVLDQTRALLEVDDVALVRADPGAGIGHLEAARGVWAPLIGQEFHSTDGIGSRVLATGQSFLSNDFQHDTTPRQLTVPATIVGLAVVALNAHGQMLGVLVAGSPRPLEATQVRLLEAIAAIAASALQRATLHENTLRRADELATLYATARELAGQPDLPHLLTTIITRALALIPAGGALVALYDPAARDLVLAGVQGLPLPLGARLPLGEGIAGQAALTGQPVIVEDYLTWEGRSSKFDSYNLRAMLAVPMLSGGNLIGVLELGEFGDSQRRFRPAEAELLLLLAGYTAVAIQNAGLLKETARRLARVQALRQVDVAITSGLELPTILSVVLDQALGQLEADAGVVTLFDPAHTRLVHVVSRGLQAGHAPTARPLRADGLLSRVIGQRSLLALPDLAEAPEHLYGVRELLAEGYRAYFAAPLIFRGQLRGVLELCRRAPGEAEPEWLEFLETLAGQAALAVENINLFDHLEQSNIELTQAYDATIEGWSRALDLRDRDTEGHSQRVTAMTLALAQAIGLNAADLVHLRRGALLHDIGKMGVPDAILHKPGPLTEAEWANMRRHPRLAYDLLTPIVYLRPALDIPYCHHEKWDGSGYPRGLRGEEIPLAARIFAVVDVWDALTSARPYRAAWSEAQTRDYLLSKAGTEFDPVVVRTFFEQSLSRVAAQTPPPKRRAKPKPR